jgi:hypothetical protein
MKYLFLEVVYFLVCLVVCEITPCMLSGFWKCDINIIIVLKF